MKIVRRGLSAAKLELDSHYNAEQTVKTASIPKQNPLNSVHFHRYVTETTLARSFYNTGTSHNYFPRYTDHLLARALIPALQTELD